MGRDVIYGGHKLFFKAADTVDNWVILEVLLVVFLSPFRNDMVIKIIIWLNSIMINYKFNSDFNSHIIFGGTQERLVALLVVHLIHNIL